MAWITQSYDNGVHVVPDSEPHVLDLDCWCEPRVEQESDWPMIVHMDELDRLGLE
jgi:hypothetical protein